jgi:hypothetical protein
VVLLYSYVLFPDAVQLLASAFSITGIAISRSACLD